LLSSEAFTVTNLPTVWASVELLPVRESKKERSAYDAQSKEEETRTETPGFGPESAADDDALDRIA